MPELTCSGTTAKGEPCRAPEALVDPFSKYCPVHTPGAAERLREIGKRGGEASAKRFKAAGLSSIELGELQTIEDAQRWFRLIAQAVGERKLTHSEGASMTRAVEAWSKSEDVRLRSQDLRELQMKVRELQGKRALERVK